MKVPAGTPVSELAVSFPGVRPGTSRSAESQRYGRLPNPPTRIPGDGRRNGYRGWRPAGGSPREGRGRPAADGRAHPARGGRRVEVLRALDRRQPARRLEPGDRRVTPTWARRRPRTASDMEPAAWFSVDGGSSWSAGELAGTADLRRERAFFADAYATYAPDGTAFCVFMGSPEGDRARPVDLPLRRRRPTLARADDSAGGTRLSSARCRPAAAASPASSSRQPSREMGRSSASRRSPDTAV